MGGCNIIDKVKGDRIGSDINKYLIALWKGLQTDTKRPLEIPRELYVEARKEYNNKASVLFTDFEIGWIGFMASFNGRFYSGGYSGIYGKRNYVDEQIRNTTKQIPLIQTIDFYSCDYQDLVVPPNSIIYCDIPYKGKKGYDIKVVFDYDKFWEWCRYMTKQGHKVFISECVAPEDFVAVWEKQIKISLHPTSNLLQTEKLFVFGGQ